MLEGNIGIFLEIKQKAGELSDKRSRLIKNKPINNTNISEEKKRKTVDQVLCENRFKTFAARDFGISEDELEKWIQENNSANSGAAGKKQGYMRQ